MRVLRRIAVLTGGLFELGELGDLFPDICVVQHLGRREVAEQALEFQLRRRPHAFQEDAQVIAGHSEARHTGVHLDVYGE